MLHLFNIVCLVIGWGVMTLGIWRGLIRLGRWIRALARYFVRWLKYDILGYGVKR